MKNRNLKMFFSYFFTLVFTCVSAQRSDTISPAWKYKVINYECGSKTITSEWQLDLLLSTKGQVIQRLYPRVFRGSKPQITFEAAPDSFSQAFKRSFEEVAQPAFQEDTFYINKNDGAFTYTHKNRDPYFPNSVFSVFLFIETSKTTPLVMDPTPIFFISTGVKYTYKGLVRLPDYKGVERECKYFTIETIEGAFRDLFLDKTSLLPVKMVNYVKINYGKTNMICTEVHLIALE